MARSALGRGLGALIPSPPDVEPQTPAPVADPVARPRPASDGAPDRIPVKSIAPNPDQPRRRFDPEELERLADSILRHGVLQPVVVRRRGVGDDTAAGYELVVGERRWRAAQLAGLDAIPAVVADVAPRQRLEVALVENVQRHDLNPIELALAFRALTEGGATQEEVGARVGLDRSSVANHLRLLELPRAMQAEVENGELSFGHAKVLLSLSHPERRAALHRRITGEGLSVREAEASAHVLGAPRKRRRPRAGAAQDPDTLDLIEGLRDRLKTQVRLRGTPARGRLEIDYFGPEELGRISALILGDG